MEEESAAEEAEQKRIAEEKAAKEDEEKRLLEGQAAKEEAQRLAEEKAAAERIANRQAEAQRIKETEQAAQNATNNNTAPVASGAPNTPQSSGAGGDSNFNTYNNTEQQNTNMSWVLNTSTLKIHYPSCRSVPKIAPQNYSTSNDSLDALKNQGYSTCGICFK